MPADLESTYDFRTWPQSCCAPGWNRPRKNAMEQRRCSRRFKREKRQRVRQSAVEAATTKRDQLQVSSKLLRTSCTRHCHKSVSRRPRSWICALTCRRRFQRRCALRRVKDDHGGARRVDKMRPSLSEPATAGTSLGQEKWANSVGRRVSGRERCWQFSHKRMSTRWLGNVVHFGKLKECVSSVSSASRALRSYRLHHLLTGATSVVSSARTLPLVATISPSSAPDTRL